MAYDLSGLLTSGGQTQSVRRSRDFDPYALQTVDVVAPRGSIGTGRGDIGAGHSGGRSSGKYGGGPGYDPLSAGDPFAGGGNFHGLMRDFRRSARVAGFQNLLDILSSNGKTDPAALNLELQGIDRGVEANQQATTGRLAGSGLEGSAAGQALLAAEGQAGVAAKSSAQARENALAEERKRQDLQLLYQLIIGPGVQKRGQDRALQAALASRQKSGFDFGSLTSLLGPLLKLFGGNGGGNGGYTPPASDPYNYPGDSGPQYTPGQDGSY